MDWSQGVQGPLNRVSLLYYTPHAKRITNIFTTIKNGMRNVQRSAKATAAKAATKSTTRVR